jgi:hypothetical protein
MVHKTTVAVIASVATVAVASILLYLYIESQKDKNKHTRRKFATTNIKNNDEKKTESTNHAKLTEAKSKEFEGKILEG